MASRLEKTLLASAARTVSETADFNNDNHRGIRLFLDVTAQGGVTPTLDVNVQVKDPASGDYVDLPDAAFAQVAAATGKQELVIYPGVAESANVSVSDVLVGDFRINVVIAGGGGETYTFSLGGVFLP